MIQIRRSFALLLIILFLLFIPTIIELLRGQKPNTDINQIFGFALILIGIYGGAYFELDRFEREIKEERVKENRQYKYSMLNIVEHWINDVSKIIDDICVIVELSPKNDQKKTLFISSDKRQEIEERLLRVDNQWLTAMAKVTDVIGIKKDSIKSLEELREEYRSLITNVYLIGTYLTKTRERIQKDKIIPDVNQYLQPLTDVRRAIDKIKLSVE